MKKTENSQKIIDSRQESHSAYPHAITVRLSVEEYRKLQDESRDFKGGISGYLRSMIASDTGEEKEKTGDNDAQKKQVIALNGLRSSFKKIAESYADVVAKFNENIENNEKFLATEQAVRIIKNLVDQTLFLQKDVNLVLNICREKEEYPVARITIKEPVLPASEAGKLTLEEFRIKYSYMQKITIVGNVAVDATTYKPKGGGPEKMKFRVIVNTVSGGTKKSISYAVFFEKSDIFQYIKKGKMVVVVGTFDQAIRHNKTDGKVALDTDGEPIIDNYIYADEVSLA